LGSSGNCCLARGFHAPIAIWADKGLLAPAESSLHALGHVIPHGLEPVGQRAIRLVHSAPTLHGASLHPVLPSLAPKAACALPWYCERPQAMAFVWDEMFTGCGDADILAWR